MNACVCVTGWHYYLDIFDKLFKIPDVDVYIVSHRPATDIPKLIYQCIPPEQIFIEPNLGYDWGCYQQFLQKGIHNNYDFVFLMHDDISILDESVFQACATIIKKRDGRCVVGNGRVDAKRDWPLTHIHCYAHSVWKPPSWQFCHDVVRGSFIATSSDALNRIGDFEVMWDRRGYLGVGAGNWSLRATLGKIQATLGDEAFVYLSETYRSSQYIYEMERGQLDTTQAKRSPMSQIYYTLLTNTSRVLMTSYMNTRSPSIKKFLKNFMQQIYHFL